MLAIRLGKSSKNALKSYRYLSSRDQWSNTKRGYAGEAGNGRKLIVGLGNPGSQYQSTRHNIGFVSVDLIAEKYGISLTKSKFNSVYGGMSQFLNHSLVYIILTFCCGLAGTIGDNSVIIVKPQTFMNLSGSSVKPWLDYYKIKEKDWYESFLTWTQTPTHTNTLFDTWDSLINKKMVNNS